VIATASVLRQLFELAASDDPFPECLQTWDLTQLIGVEPGSHVGLHGFGIRGRPWPSATGRLALVGTRVRVAQDQTRSLDFLFPPRGHARRARRRHGRSAAASERRSCLVALARLKAGQFRQDVPDGGPRVAKVDESAAPSSEEGGKFSAS